MTGLCVSGFNTDSFSVPVLVGIEKSPRSEYSFPVTDDWWTSPSRVGSCCVSVLDGLWEILPKYGPTIPSPSIISACSPLDCPDVFDGSSVTNFPSSGFLSLNGSVNFHGWFSHGVSDSGTLYSVSLYVLFLYP